MDTYTRTNVHAALRRSTQNQPTWWPHSNPSRHSSRAVSRLSVLNSKENKNTACLKLRSNDQLCLQLLQNNYPLARYHFPATFTSSHTSSWNNPPIWYATPTRLPRPWPVLLAGDLSYIMIPLPLTGTICSPWSISHDCNNKLCAPSTCKTFLTTTSCFRPPGNRSISRTSPCTVALPAFLPAKSCISRSSLLVYSVYRSNLCRSPQMWAVVAQSKFQLSFDGASLPVVVIQ